MLKRKLKVAKQIIKIQQKSSPVFQAPLLLLMPTLITKMFFLLWDLVCFLQYDLHMRLFQHPRLHFSFLLNHDSKSITCKGSSVIQRRSWWITLQLRRGFLNWFWIYVSCFVWAWVTLNLCGKSRWCWTRLFTIQVYCLRK